jgi:hypothetical protein
MFIQSVYKFDGKEYPEYTQTSLAEFSATGKTSSVRSVYKLLDAYTVEMTRRDPSGKIATINTQICPEMQHANRNPQESQRRDYIGSSFGAAVDLTARSNRCARAARPGDPR